MKAKPIIIGVSITLGVIFVIMLAAWGRANERRQNDVDTTQVKVTQGQELSQYEIRQLDLIKKYGEPKPGFRWRDDGTLQALGDSTLTPTEVVYTYLRALSTLDFATASRYSEKSETVTAVERQYSSNADVTYDSNFKKEMYRQVLLSIEPVGIENVSTFANFKQNISMKINVLDLSNKDFWLIDRDEIFSNLHTYKKTEQDTTKAKNYLYDYVLNYYKSEAPVRKTVTVNFVLEETIEGGWLITSDADIDTLASYAEGELVVSNILVNFDKWLSTGN